MQIVNTIPLNTSSTFDRPLTRTGSERYWIFWLSKVSLITRLPFLVVCVEGWRVCLSVNESALPKTNRAASLHIFSDNLDHYFLVFFIVFSLCRNTEPLYFFAEIQPCTLPCINDNEPLSLCISLCNLTTSYCLFMAHVVCVYNLLLPWLYRWYIWNQVIFEQHTFKWWSICC